MSGNIRFRKEWLQCYDWLSPNEDNCYAAKCKVCCQNIKVCYMGKEALEQHKRTKKHTKRMQQEINKFLLSQVLQVAGSSAGDSSSHIISGNATFKPIAKLSGSSSTPHSRNISTIDNCSSSQHISPVSICEPIPKRPRRSSTPHSDKNSTTDSSSSSQHISPAEIFELNAKSPECDLNESCSRKSSSTDDCFPTQPISPRVIVIPPENPELSPASFSELSNHSKDKSDNGSDFFSQHMSPVVVCQRIAIPPEFWKKQFSLENSTTMNRSTDQTLSPVAVGESVVTSPEISVTPVSRKNFNSNNCSTDQCMSPVGLLESVATSSEIPVTPPLSPKNCSKKKLTELPSASKLGNQIRNEDQLQCSSREAKDSSVAHSFINEHLTGYKLQKSIDYQNNIQTFNKDELSSVSSAAECLSVFADNQEVEGEDHLRGVQSPSEKDLEFSTGDHIINEDSPLQIMQKDRDEDDNQISSRSGIICSHENGPSSEEKCGEVTVENTNLQLEPYQTSNRLPVTTLPKFKRLFRKDSKNKENETFAQTSSTTAECNSPNEDVAEASQCPFSGTFQDSTTPSTKLRISSQFPEISSTDAERKNCRFLASSTTSGRNTEPIVNACHSHVTETFQTLNTLSLQNESVGAGETQGSSLRYSIKSVLGGSKAVASPSQSITEPHLCEDRRFVNTGGFASSISYFFNRMRIAKQNFDMECCNILKEFEELVSESVSSESLDFGEFNFMKPFLTKYLSNEKSMDASQIMKVLLALFSCKINPDNNDFAPRKKKSKKKCCSKRKIQPDERHRHVKIRKTSTYTKYKRLCSHSNKKRRKMKKSCNKQE